LLLAILFSTGIAKFQSGMQVLKFGEEKYILEYYRAIFVTLILTSGLPEQLSKKM